MHVGVCPPETPTCASETSDLFSNPSWVCVTVLPYLVPGSRVGVLIAASTKDLINPDMKQAVVQQLVAASYGSMSSHSRQVMHANACPLSIIHCFIYTGKPSVVQLLNYKKNGDPFINYLSITPIHDSRGHVTHFVGIQSDVSDLVNHKKAELAAKHEAAQVSLMLNFLSLLPIAVKTKENLLTLCFEHMLSAQRSQNNTKSFTLCQCKGCYGIHNTGHVCSQHVLSVALMGLCI